MKTNCENWKSVSPQESANVDQDGNLKPRAGSLTSSLMWVGRPTEVLFLDHEWAKKLLRMGEDYVKKFVPDEAEDLASAVLSEAAQKYTLTRGPFESYYFWLLSRRKTD